MNSNGQFLLNGVLIVDKPSDWTSHDVCHFIRKKFGIAKVGHAGILDRTATGVLVVLLGFYTKLSSQFLNQIKEYEGTLELGMRTTTHDAAGDPVEKLPWDQVTEDQVREVMKGFRGESEQLPPMASAVKLGGVRLYKLARQGKDIERPTKMIHIYELNILHMELPLVRFYSKVSKGTYIRTLANDIGEDLGTCAHLKELRRTASGDFRIEDSVTVDFLKSLKSREELKPYLRQGPLKDPVPVRNAANKD